MFIGLDDFKAVNDDTAMENAQTQNQAPGGDLPRVPRTMILAGLIPLIVIIATLIILA